MVQGKINRGRHADHPAGRHSIRTNQCPPPPSSIFYRPDALPAAQPTVSKHRRQLALVSKQLWTIPAGSTFESRVCPEADGVVRSTFRRVSRRLHPDSVQVVERANRLLRGAGTPAWLLLLLGGYSFCGPVARSCALHSWSTLRHHCPPRSRWSATGGAAGYD